MKVLIAVSSKTGNTQKIADAISTVLPKADLCDVNEAPNPDAYDLIYLGFWVDKGTADEKAQKYMSRIKNKKVALFATLGAYPDSEHAKTSLIKAAEHLPDCHIVDSFICQGAIDPKLIEWMKQLPQEHPHAPDEDRVKRWNDARSHPDAIDCYKASTWAMEVYTQAA